MRRFFRIILSCSEFYGKMPQPIWGGACPCSETCTEGADRQRRMTFSKAGHVDFSVRKDCEAAKRLAERRRIRILHIDGQLEKAVRIFIGGHGKHSGFALTKRARPYRQCGKGYPDYGKIAVKCNSVKTLRRGSFFFGKPVGNIQTTDGFCRPRLIFRRVSQ